MLVLWELFPWFLYITFLRLRTNPNNCLKSSNPSICTSLLHDVLDDLLFMQLSNLHLLWFSHGSPNCLGVLLTLCFPGEGHHFRPHPLTSGFCNVERLHGRVFIHGHSAQIRHSRINIHTYFSGWAQTNLSDASNSVLLMPWRKWQTYFGAFVHTTVSIICNILHEGMTFLVECDIFVPIPPFPLTIIVRGLQLSFCFCSLPGHGQA